MFSAVKCFLYHSIWVEVKQLKRSNHNGHHVITTNTKCYIIKQINFLYNSTNEHGGFYNSVLKLWSLCFRRDRCGCFVVAFISYSYLTQLSSYLSCPSLMDSGMPKLTKANGLSLFFISNSSWSIVTIFLFG